MHKEQDKYQNILTHLHELNRQNLLNENDKNEYLSNELEKINEKINDISSNNTKSTNKLIIVIVLLLIINTALVSYLVLKQSTNSTNEQQIINTEELVEKEVESTVIDSNKSDNEEEQLDPNINTFNTESMDILEVEEEFKEIVPIIRKGTPYICKDDVNTYKIPYTVDIKGKLYSDRFSFILQEKSGRKECSIKKEDM